MTNLTPVPWYESRDGDLYHRRCSVCRVMAGLVQFYLDHETEQNVCADCVEKRGGLKQEES